jgi:hypothetical protein
MMPRNAGAFIAARDLLLRYSTDYDDEVLSLLEKGLGCSLA